MQQLIHRLKYRRQQQLGHGLGRLLARELTTAPGAPTVLLPIPLHRSRLLERGYNQSFEIARGVAAVSGLRLLTAGVSRWRPTPPQAGLSQTARQSNVRDAFRVERTLTGIHVWLVDDVITTGATANALASALLAAGAHGVSAMAVARG